MPMGRSFLFGTAPVKSYVVHPMPDDESVAMSSLLFSLMRSARFARASKYRSYVVAVTINAKTITVEVLEFEKEKKDF